jgi:hypothetical protein
MSGPVPSPSMNGMIGLSGTTSCPFFLEMAAPVVGGLSAVGFGICFRSGHLPSTKDFRK